jgi:hypothetical protein
MSVPAFGFSVGDFIAAIQLLVQGYKALQTADGAAAEFQQQVAWLESLIPTLTTLQSSKPNGLDDVLHACEGPLTAFKEKIKKYEKYLKCRELAPTTVKARALDSAKNARFKLQWAFGASKDVIELREAIGEYLLIINSRLGIQALFVAISTQQTNPLIHQ